MLLRDLATGASPSAISMEITWESNYKMDNITIRVVMVSVDTLRAVEGLSATWDNSARIPNRPTTFMLRVMSKHEGFEQQLHEFRCE